MSGLDGMQAKENLKLISEICHRIVDHQYQILNDVLVPELQNKAFVLFAATNGPLNTALGWRSIFTKN